MTKLLTRDSEYLETEAAARLKEAGENPLNREILRQTHPAIGTRILRMAYGKYAPGMSMTAEQTDTLYTMAAAENRQTRHLSLPGGVTAVIRCNTVRFMTGTGRAETESDRKQHPAEREVPPLTPGETVILDWGARKIVLSRKSLPKHPENLENIYNLSIQHPINFAKIKGVLCLRTRKAGDTIRYGGMARKIRKLQNEYRVPPEKRETMLLLADEEEILWAEGWEACDKVKSDRTENDILWIGIWCPRGPEETEDPVRIQKHDETTEADHGTEDRPG